MISKAKAKYIKSLQVKKYRIEEQRFLVEGAKSVLELLNSSFEVDWVAATEAFLGELLSSRHKGVEFVTATASELASVGTLQSNDAAVAVARMKVNAPIKLGPEEFGLALDDIRDPGNLGTIIRTADWYGINKLVVSKETADFYNPKTISATMGSFARVQLYYCQLPEFLHQASVPIYGTFLEGESVHRLTFEKSGWLVIGNEAHGISPDVARCVTRKITIPRFGQAESLNAGIATAVVLDSLRRS